MRVSFVLIISLLAGLTGCEGEVEVGDPAPLIPDMALPELDVAAPEPDMAPPIPDMAPPKPDMAPPTPDRGPDVITQRRLPDLLLLEDKLREDIWLDERDFSEESCGFQEGCVNGTGKRLLLRFGVTTANIGQADLYMGRPESAGNGLFEWGECHGHWHFSSYARYELQNEQGTEIVPGHKQAFCLMDTGKYNSEDPRVRERPRYNCGFQGISRGWQDTYHSRLDCQWIDVTDVDPGDYQLFVEVNGQHIIEEENYDNNTHTIPVVVPPYQIDQDCPEDVHDGLRRSCGWTPIENRMCETGNIVHIGAGACGLGGECLADSMMRVCDGDGQCLPSSALSQRNNSCDTDCPYVEFACPESGAYTVWMAPNIDGEVVPMEYVVEESEPEPVDEECGDEDEDGLNRGCGWTIALDTVECGAGFEYRVGCTPDSGMLGCGLGEECEGDTMIRVCPGDLRCDHRFALAQNDDACDSYCSSTTFTCPANGQATVLTAAYRIDRGFSCNVEMARDFDAPPEEDPPAEQ